MWSVLPQAHWRIRSWEGEDAAIVYNAQSGETHLLDTPGAEVLQTLATKPGTSEDLAHDLAGLFEDGADPADVIAFVEATLVQLQAIGLVSAAVPP